MKVNKSVIRSAHKSIEEAVKGTIGGAIATLVNEYGDTSNGLFELEHALKLATGAASIVAVMEDGRQLSVCQTPGANQASKRCAVQLAAIARRQASRSGNDNGQGTYSLVGADGKVIFSDKADSDFEFADIVAFSDAVTADQLSGKITLIRER